MYDGVAAGMVLFLSRIFGSRFLYLLQHATTIWYVVFGAVLSLYSLNLFKRSSAKYIFRLNLTKHFLRFSIFRFF